MMINKSFRIKAVLFDFDGTLTKPGALNFPLLKETIGCPVDIPVLEFIESLPTPRQREKTFSVLERIEINAAADSEPNSGAEDLIHYLRLKGLGVGIITRNRFQCIKRALQNFNNIGVSDFDVIISRDTPAKPKPSGDGILLAAQTLNVDVNQVLVVGDYIFDIQAGHSAGCITTFLDHGTASGQTRIESDFTITRLEEIKKIISLRPLRLAVIKN